MAVNPHLSPNDWDQWAKSPATQAFVASLKDAVEEVKESWSQQAFTEVNTNTAALAEVRALRKVMDAIADCEIKPTDKENDNDE